MKYKTIVFGCLISCLILLIIPNISATQYKLTINEIEDKLEDIQELGLIERENEYPILCKILLILSNTFTILSYPILAILFYADIIDLQIIEFLSWVLYLSLFGFSYICNLIAEKLGCDGYGLKGINYNLLPLIQKE
jgi:hypothetical protein